MLREFNEPKDFESFLYVSQVLQAEGIKIGAEHFRRIMPRNMGSLYWQANDCWQVASWSGMDYFGRWKALMYYTKKFYAPMLISPHVDDDNNLGIYVVSDFPEAEKAKIALTLMDFGGRVYRSRELDVTVEPLKGKSYFTQPLEEFVGGVDRKNTVLIAELKIGGQVVSQNEYFFAPFKELQISNPLITTRFGEMRDHFEVTLSTDKLARSVYLSGFESGRFSDNYFNLLPGKPVTVKFRPAKKMNLEEFRSTLRIRSLIDAF